ncbi:MAG: LytTR family transcriptional regulator DNA-binding domain-containing protein, partial [Oscillospiraceae bacterium]|nr:LytTR family transcriptional regulator DNA-binding domain-containing protein [Oscillospiraceae bacterium]
DFTYKIGHDDFKVQIKDIVYLESKKRKIALHLADGRKMEFYGMLKEIYHQQLQKFDFLLIHASFAVNYDYISALKYDEVVLANGVTTLPVSRNKRNEVREAYYTIVERRRV